MDFKVLPRTNFSFDEFLNWYKGDTSIGDNNLTYQLANGQLVDLGISWDTPNSSPCKIPITSSTTSPPTAAPTAMPSRITFAARRRGHPTRPSSSIFNQIISITSICPGRLMYSSADARVMNYDELFQGFESRSLDRQLSTTGNAAINRISVSAD